MGTYAVAPEAPSGIRRLLVLFALIAVALVLWFGRPVLMPLALAALLSFLLSPLCEWLERNRVPRALSVILVFGGSQGSACNLFKRTRN